MCCVYFIHVCVLCIYIYIFVCLCAYIFIYACVCVHACVWTYACVYLCICVNKLSFCLYVFMNKDFSHASNINRKPINQ